MPHYPDKIEYSAKYTDVCYEYRHVILPRDVFGKLPVNKLLSDMEWRGLGISMSKGWTHYTIHKPEPHILLFRRPIGTDPETGNIPHEIVKKLSEYENEIKAFWNASNN